MGSAFRSAVNMTKKMGKIPEWYDRTVAKVDKKIPKIAKTLYRIPSWQKKMAKKAIKRAVGYGARGRLTTHDAVDSLSKLRDKQGGARDYFRVGGSLSRLFAHGKKQEDILPPAEDYRKWPKGLRDQLAKGGREHAKKMGAKRSGKTRTTTDSPRINVSVKVATPRPRQSPKRLSKTGKRTTKR